MCVCSRLDIVLSEVWKVLMRLVHACITMSVRNVVVGCDSLYDFVTLLLQVLGGLGLDQCVAKQLQEQLNAFCSDTCNGTTSKYTDMSVYITSQAIYMYNCVERYCC